MALPKRSSAVAPYIPSTLLTLLSLCTAMTTWSAPPESQKGPGRYIPADPCAKALSTKAQATTPAATSSEDESIAWGSFTLPVNFSIQDSLVDESVDAHPAWIRQEALPIIPLQSQITALQSDLNTFDDTKISVLARMLKIPQRETLDIQELRQAVFAAQAAKLRKVAEAQFELEPDSFEAFLANHAEEEYRIPRHLGAFILKRSLRWSAIPGGVYPINRTLGAVSDSTSEKAPFYVAMPPFEISSLPVTQGLALMVLGPFSEGFSGVSDAKKSDGYWLTFREKKVNLFYPATFRLDEAQTFTETLQQLYYDWRRSHDDSRSGVTHTFEDRPEDTSDISVSSLFENTIAAQGTPPLPPLSAQGHGLSPHNHLESNRNLWHHYRRWIASFIPEPESYTKELTKFFGDATAMMNGHLPTPPELALSGFDPKRFDFSYERSAVNFFGLHRAPPLVCLEFQNTDRAFNRAEGLFRRIESGLANSSLESPFVPHTSLDYNAIQHAASQAWNEDLGQNNLILGETSTSPSPLWKADAPGLRHRIYENPSNSAEQRPMPRRALRITRRKASGNLGW